MTASSRASKIADSRSRSDDSAPNVSRSAILMVSRAVPRSVISSRTPVPSRGSSSLPSVIRAALPASRFTRVVMADRDRGRGEAVPAKGVDGSHDLLGPLGPGQHRARDTPVAKDRG